MSGVDDPPAEDTSASENGLTLRRDRLADDRDDAADERDRVADARDELAADRRREADAVEADASAELRQELHANRAQRIHLLDIQASQAKERHTATDVDSLVGAPQDAWDRERRDFLADDREERADVREVLADELQQLADERERYLPAVADDSYGAGAHAATAARELAADSRAAAAQARTVAARERAALPVARPLVDAFLSIAQALSSPMDLDEAYLEAVAQARRLVSGAMWVSLAVSENGRVRTAAASDMTAAGLDSVQYVSGLGPCVEAIAECRPVLSDNLAVETRWPSFAAAATAAHAHSTLSAPVPHTAQPATAAGSINHYGQTLAAFDSESVHTAILLAAHLAALLAVADQANSQILHLGKAVEGRDIIGQAKGILMERDGLNAEQAFDVLRTASMKLNRKLRDLADMLTYTGRLPDMPANDSTTDVSTCRDEMSQ